MIERRKREEDFEIRTTLVDSRSSEKSCQQIKSTDGVKHTHTHRLLKQRLGAAGRRKGKERQKQEKM